MVSAQSQSIFNFLPKQVEIAARAEGTGLYSIHVKVNSNGAYETFNRLVNPVKALEIMEFLRSELQLSEDAVYIGELGEVSISSYFRAARIKRVLDRNGLLPKHVRG